MNPKEIVKRAIHFQNPERMPIMGLLVDWVRWKNDCTPEIVEEVERMVATIDNDILYLNYDAPAEVYEREVIDETVYDDWGVGWVFASGVNVKLLHPLGDGWDKLDSLKVPDTESRKCYNWVRDIAAANKDKYILATAFFTLFERLWFIRGMENMLMDPLVDYNNFKKLRDKIMEYNYRNIEKWIKVEGVDGLFLSDDWGSQHGLLIRPSDWRKFYKPCYKELFGMIKSAGIDVWMHLDGNIMEIVPDLIEVGLEVYNPVQNNCNDIPLLGKDFRGKLCFNGGVDVQETLPLKTPEKIKEEVDMVASTLGDSRGGFIMSASHTIIPGVPLENMRALVEAIRSYIK